MVPNHVFGFLVLRALEITGEVIVPKQSLGMPSLRGLPTRHNPSYAR